MPEARQKHYTNTDPLGVNIPGGQVRITMTVDLRVTFKCVGTEGEVQKTVVIRGSATAERQGARGSDPQITGTPSLQVQQ